MTRTTSPLTTIEAAVTDWPSRVTLVTVSGPKLPGTSSDCAAAPAGTATENDSCLPPADHTVLVIAVAARASLNASQRWAVHIGMPRLCA